MEEQVQAMNLFNFDLDKFQMTINNIPITIVGKYDSPWFSGKEICMGFGYKNIQDALYKHVKSKHFSRSQKGPMRFA
jgi:prophage antirepressor-like protein